MFQLPDSKAFILLLHSLFTPSMVLNLGMNQRDFHYQYRNDV